MSVPEDEIIKRKLLIEGSGGGDEKKIHGLVKKFAKWCMEDVSSEENESTFNNLIDTLLHCQLSSCKFQEVFYTSQVEQENYKKLNIQIEEQIKQAQCKIAESKLELENALVVRRYKEEYDALAKIIDKHPEREQLLKELGEIDEELVKSEQLKKHYDTKLSERRRQFHVLITSLHELQNLINADEEENFDSQEEEMDQT